MVLRFVVPMLGKAKTTKDAIISELAQEAPQSIRKLHHSLGQKYGLSVTYQAVFKSIKELLEDSVIIQIEKKYQLNNEWIKRIKKFMDVIEKNQKRRSVEMEQYVLNSISEVDSFLAESAVHLLEQIKEPIIYVSWSHFLVPLFLDKDVYVTMRMLGKVAKIYSVTSGATPIDKWCYEFWRNESMNVKIGIEPMGDVAIIDDYVFQIFYPEDLKARINKIFSSAHTTKELDREKLFTTIFERQAEIPIIVRAYPSRPVDLHVMIPHAR